MTRRPAGATSVERLRALADAPAEQAALAVRLLETKRTATIVQAALDVLAARPEPAARPVLLERYAHFAADGTRRDAGTYLRVAVLKALRPIARQDDVPLLERAAMTIEFIPPGPSEVAAPLRATALVVLSELDDRLAGYHAVRLLSDPHTERMSGEPAVTAARVLAAGGHARPLYAFAVGVGDPVPDVVSECLRHLTDLPAVLLADLVERYREARDEIVLVGLIDLIVEHEARAAHLDVVADLLATTRALNIYRYLSTMIVASRKRDLLGVLLAAAGEEQDPRRVQILLDALVLRKGDPEVDRLIGELEQRV